jgi:DNA replicative helicase MCM subunit Mcm2 (Cdc46/Mcm family)
VNEAFGDLRIFFDSEDDLGNKFYLKFRKKGIQKSISFNIHPGVVNLNELVGSLTAAKKTMKEGVTWVCKKCGEEYKQAFHPEKCDTCGHPNFEAWRTHFKEFRQSCGSLYVSLEKKDNEPVLILENYSSDREMSYHKVLGELDGLVKQVKEIKEDYENVLNPDDEPEFLEDVEDVISDLSKIQVNEIKEKASDKGISEESTEEALDSLKRQGEIIEVEEGKIKEFNL